MNTLRQFINKTIYTFHLRCRRFVGWWICFMHHYSFDNFPFRFTSPQKNGGFGTFETMATEYLKSRYYHLPERKRRQILLKKIWGGKAGSIWHQEIKPLYNKNKLFMKTREPLLQFILSLPKSKYNGLIELGCGNGWFLNLLSERLPFLHKFIGLDVNQKTVRLAQTRYQTNHRLTFLTTDLNAYAKTHTLKKKVLVSCFVLEYFSTQELVRLCHLLKQHRPLSLAFIERVRQDSLKTKRSQAIGDFSFSHNYPEIFKDCGLTKLKLKRSRIPDDSDFINFVGLLMIE
ncbi:hypothetical protein A2783_02850 [Microgenomates group bacterium RIFCSPHIGHO2_01_FULL_45_11]|nr:MAG: hypothetical protein A2783_02850 [Microgenomates group bacterium RIFCSPHIGHO2_01_FULL_45_11]